MSLTPDLLQEAFFKAPRLPTEDLDLRLSGLRANREGRSPSDEELAALRAHNAETERLGRLAGFGSVQEVRDFLDRSSVDPNSR
jgi:hypothetical protein